jgi:acetyl esterase/lipase
MMYIIFGAMVSSFLLLATACQPIQPDAAMAPAAEAEAIAPEAATATPAPEAAAPAAEAAASEVLRPALTEQYAVKLTSGVVFGEAPVMISGTVTNTQLLLELYEPVDAPPMLRPVIVIVHGGAFFRGTRLEKSLDMASRGFAARGYVVASIDYRLGAGPDFAKTYVVGAEPVVAESVAAYQTLVDSMPTIHFLDELKPTVTPEVFKLLNDVSRLGQAATLEDTITATNWLAGKADELSLDMSRLVMMGGSAGAITALYAAYGVDDLNITAPRVAAVLNFWGAFNLDDFAKSDDGVVMLEAGEAPVYIVHGTADKSVPFMFGELIFARANEVGTPVEFTQVPNGGHGFDKINIFTTEAEAGVTIFQQAVAFLDQVLFGAAQ